MPPRLHTLAVSAALLCLAQALPARGAPICAAGEIVVIRDWGAPVLPKASEVANVHDCLVVLDQILGR